MATGPLEKTIPCTVDGCDRMFARPHDLETHLRNGHRDKPEDSSTPDLETQPAPSGLEHAAETQERFEAAATDAAIDEAAAGHGLTRERFDNVVEAPAVHTGEPAKPGQAIESLNYAVEERVKMGTTPLPTAADVFRTVPSGTKSAIPANAEEAARLAVQSIKVARDCLGSIRKAGILGGVGLADETAVPLGRALRMICERFPDADK